MALRRSKVVTLTGGDFETKVAAEYPESHIRRKFCWEARRLTLMRSQIILSHQIGKKSVKIKFNNDLMTS